MSPLIGNLTQGELVMVLGRLVQEVGQNLHDGDYADGVQLSEAFELVQKTFQDLLAEYQDTD